MLNARGLAELPELAGWCGVALMLAAVGVRVWAARTLGAFYTRTLRTTAGQRIVSAGPYRVIRHPGYAAAIVLWLGAGLATANGLVTVAILLLIVTAYRARIAAEEAMLLEAFGDAYRTYSRRTWRLLPPIY